MLLVAALLAIYLYNNLWTYPTYVYGNVTPQDVSEIKSAIRKSVRARLFPTLSWTNIATLSGSIRIYYGQHIQAVSGQPDGTVTVNVRYHHPGKGLNAELYHMRKDSKGWSIIYTQLLVD